MDIELWIKRKNELGYTYDDIAKKAKLGRRTIANVFSGNRTNPTIETIQKIEKALELSDFTPEEINQGVKKYAIRNITPEEDDLLEDFRQLGIKKGTAAQKTAHDVIKAMLST